MDNNTPTQPPEEDPWFSKIKTRKGALKIIKDTANTFYVIAALQIALGYFFGNMAMLNFLIFVIPAFLLWKFKSRAAAIILLFLSIDSTVTTVINMVGAKAGGNIIIAFVMLWVSVRSIRATFKLHKLQNGSAL